VILSTSVSKATKQLMMANYLNFGLLAFIGSSMMVWPCDGQGVPNNATYPLATSRTGSNALQPFRFYAGIHAAAQQFRVASPTYYTQEVVIRPLYVFVGYQFGPHLGVQVGFLQHNPPSASYSNTSFNQAGQLIEGHGYQDWYNGAVPILLRYRLARRPTHRLHLDALLGVTVEFNHYLGDDMVTVGGQVQYHVHVDSHPTNTYLTAGLGAEYDVTPHVGLMVEGTANRNTTALDADYARKPTFGLGAGLRYRFNIGRSTEQRQL